MGQRNLIIIAAAVFFGLLAVFLTNSFFAGVETKQADFAAENRMARIVVASQALAFGVPVSSQNVRLANWPANSVPQGAFTSIADATKNRVVLRPIVPGEPVLASKVSGVDGRATLSANLPAGQLAVSIPISDVAGVGGFVRPGDVVDVLLTRKIPGEGAQEYDKMTDVVLEAVPVLAIDQVSDENKTEAEVGKTATLQVDTMGAQKLALSTQLGVMNLALRNVSDQVQVFHQTVTRRDLARNRMLIPARRERSSAPAPSYASAMPMAMPRAGGLAAPPLSGPSMTIVRGIKLTEEALLRGY